MQLAKSITKKLSWIDNVVNYVWIFLIILMIITLYLIYMQFDGVSKEFCLIIVLIIATVTYPLYTLGFKLIPGLIGNIIYALLSLYIILEIWKVLPIGSMLLVPTFIWITIATIYVIAQIRA